MSANANYLCSLGQAWLPPESPHWRLDLEVSVALSLDLGGEVPSRDELARGYAELVSGKTATASTRMPIQSLYEPWTLDPDCELAFAQARGLRRGDAALHMEHVLATLGMELPLELGLDADHVAVILNAAAEIAERFPDELDAFAVDHLGWLGAYAREAHEAWGNPRTAIPQAVFYLALLRETARVAEGLRPTRGRDEITT